MADPKPATWNFHIWQIALLVLIAEAIGWSAFIKPTTKIADGGVQNNFYEIPKVPMFGCSAWRLRNELYWQSKTPITQKAIKK